MPFPSCRKSMCSKVPPARESATFAAFDSQAWKSRCHTMRAHNRDRKLRHSQDHHHYCPSSSAPASRARRSLLKDYTAPAHIMQAVLAMEIEAVHARHCFSSVLLAPSLPIHIPLTNTTIRSLARIASQSRPLSTLDNPLARSLSTARFSTLVS